MSKPESEEIKEETRHSDENLHQNREENWQLDLARRVLAALTLPKELEEKFEYQDKVVAK